ncbi:MAG: macro domain-containing protein [Limisphaerales bacterium]
MITYVIGDLFHSPAKVLVNTVNILGVMGKGIAKDFKTIFPEMFHDYQKLCERKKIDIGKLFLWRGPHKWVLNFPTKKHWRNPSKPEYIETGLKAFVAGYARHSITSIAFPQLGCGHGELNWETQVQPLMEKHLGKLPIEIFIHLYRKDPFAPREHEDIEATKRWLRSEPESLSFSEVWDDLCEILKRQSEFGTLDKHERFHVRGTDTPAEGLIVADGQELFVPQDALLEAWQHLRSVGFLSAEGLTHGLDLHASKVIAIMAELPYLKPVQLAIKQSARNGVFSVALQFVPRPAKEGAVPQRATELVMA